MQRIMIKNCPIEWAKLIDPERKFEAAGVWQADIVLDEEAAKQVTATGGKYRTKDGRKLLRVKKNVKRRDGTMNNPPRVVDANRVQLSDDAVRALGNGSVCNYSLSPYEWTFSGNRGVTFYLDAVQVVDYKEFKPTNNDPFEVIAEATIKGEEPVISSDMEF